MASSNRGQVLSLYRRILRVGWSWKAQNPSETKTERDYIINETQQLFRANKNITNMKNIKEHVAEGEARLEMAIHYKTPYPRPVNMPPNTITKGWGRGNIRRQNVSRPVYIKSIDNTS
ncbi:LYR motif-containing protein 1-like [Homarus americanus]|uniref:LYR motif-containing protein 1-like n=2 Tax=Homarus americanus TaxID=6706 RepID=A0A8J5KC60_HOMAM|nr:LYR motif-containing protein 1-like [Homarus americanus]